MVSVDASEGVTKAARNSAERTLQKGFLSRIKFESKTVEEFAAENPQGRSRSLLAGAESYF